MPPSSKLPAQAHDNTLGDASTQPLAPSSAVGGREGQVIAGKYQLVRLLGSGGMGAVYEGRNRMTTKRCAVKLLLYPELAENDHLVRRFFREARAGSSVESDHIVEIYDSGSDPETGCPYMVMELLVGEDLASVTKRLGAIDPTAAAKLVLQTAVGLAKAHAVGIVHRDIKPANLFLTQRDAGDLTVKILDFGIAKLKLENFHETSTALTRSGSLLGTPLYMSPEQCKGAKALDARSDVWSLGVVLWELLAGGSPYSPGSSLGSLMASIITETLPLLQDRAPWVAPQLAEIVHRAMSRDLAQRFQHAGEMRDALAQFLAPDGPLLWPPITPLPDAERAIVAPRLVLTDDGLLRATDRPADALAQSGERLRASSRWLIGLLATSALGAAAAVVIARAPPPASSAETPPPPPPSAASAVALIQPAAPVTKKFSLKVAPEHVKASVDGASAVVQDGKLLIEGVVGTTRRLKLTLKGQSEERLIAITESGLVPDRVELATRRAAPKASPPAPTQPVEPTAKPASDLSEGTEEFGK